MSTNQKIGLLPLITIVIGSQVGSGVFMLPQMLAPFGVYALIGWLISGTGALSLAMVFVGLVKRLPKTGGPHVYVNAAFGKTAAYFTGWTYWLVASLGSATVIGSTINYLTPIIGIQSPLHFAAYELILVLLVCLVNLRGVVSAGIIESVLGVIKIITLIFVPLAGLLMFNSNHIQVASTLSDASHYFLIGKTASLTLWAFLGVETATTPAESVDNPKITIPTALLSGTSCVIFLYLLNSISLMGLVPQARLAATHTPYVLATQIIFGGNWHLIIAGFAALVCLSNLNAWVLASGQIANGIANDNLFPSIFKKKNRYGSPSNALIMSCALIVPLILFTIDDDISKQIFTIIDLSVQASLFIYLICIISYFCILCREKKPWWHYEKIVSAIASVFCLCMTASSDVSTLMYAMLFPISGIPVYCFWIKKKTT